MQVYKELVFVGEKKALDELSTEIYDVFPSNWKKPHGDDLLLKDYILADYDGTLAPRAEVSIYYGRDAWREGSIRVCNIVPLEKRELTVEEYNKVLNLFYIDIAKKYCEIHKNVKLVGPSSEQFDPLNYISDEALKKLTYFCDAANKSTGSSHPSDEERWFDFICQTVDDKRMFDYDTLFNFLIDEDYWGRKEEGFLGVIGHFAWDKENAQELAMEYDNYVRILQYYKRTRQERK